MQPPCHAELLELLIYRVDFHSCITAVHHLLSMIVELPKAWVSHWDATNSSNLLVAAVGVQQGHGTAAVGLQGDTRTPGGNTVSVWIP